MEEQPITLPQELQDQIITYVAADWFSGRYLKTCALVSKKWLQQARRHYFSNRTLEVFQRGGQYQKTLQGFLYQNEPMCTFWPYILDIYFGGSYDQWEKSYDFIDLLSLCLSRASNLRTIRFSAVAYSDSLKEAISNLAATKGITSVYIQGLPSYFQSPKELDLFLGLFPQLRIQCELSAIRFYSMEWDFTTSCVFSPPSSLPFSISIVVQENSVLELFFPHQWNITYLSLDFKESIDFHLLTNALNHIGASLKSLSLGLRHRRFRGSLPLSLSHNTSLKSFHVSGLAEFDMRDPTLQLTWLAPVLNTIESRRNFQDFRGIIFGSKNYYGVQDTVCQWLTSLNWAPVEDVMLDLKRFPGQPTFTLALRGGLKWGLDRSVLKEECMPRLAKAGRLLVAEGSNGEGSIID